MGERIDTDILQVFPVDATGEPPYRMCVVWCPGCKSHHTLPIERDRKLSWVWDGNVQSPTFTPSLLRYGAKGPNWEILIPRCHSFIKSGKWEFLADCDHELAGQTVNMVTLPPDHRW